MAIALRTDSFIAPTVTRQTLYNGIKQAFANAGYSAPIDEYETSYDAYCIYEIILDAAKAYGKAYLRIRVNNDLGIANQLFATWDTAANTGQYAGNDLGYNNLANNIQVNFVSLNAAPEYRFVLIHQLQNYYPLGYIQPANKPAWWDMTSFPFIFIPSGIGFGDFRCTGLSPVNTIGFDSNLNNYRMQVANPVTNRRDILAGVFFYAQSNQGIVARTSDDLIMVSASGLTRFDIIQVPEQTQEYLLLNPNYGGLAVRVV